MNFATSEIQSSTEWYIGQNTFCCTINSAANYNKYHTSKICPTCREIHNTRNHNKESYSKCQFYKINYEEILKLEEYISTTTKHERYFYSKWSTMYGKLVKY